MNMHLYVMNNNSTLWLDSVEYVQVSVLSK